LHISSKNRFRLGSTAPAREPQSGRELSGKRYRRRKTGQYTPERGIPRKRIGRPCPDASECGFFYLAAILGERKIDGVFEPVGGCHPRLHIGTVRPEALSKGISHGIKGFDRASARTDWNYSKFVEIILAPSESFSGQTGAFSGQTALLYRARMSGMGQEKNIHATALRFNLGAAMRRFLPRWGRLRG
jgi:hypothetical protein